MAKYRAYMLFFLILFLCVAPINGVAEGTSERSAKAVGTSLFERLKDALFGEAGETSMSYTEIIAALRDLGIEIPDQGIRDIEDFFAEQYAEEIE